jgi:hypothetical protein
MSDNPDAARKRQTRIGLLLNAVIDVGLGAVFLFFGPSLLGVSRDVAVLVAIAFAAFAVFSAAIALTFFRAPTDRREGGIVERR